MPKSTNLYTKRIGCYELGIQNIRCLDWECLKGGNVIHSEYTYNVQVYAEGFNFCGLKLIEIP